MDWDPNTHESLQAAPIVSCPHFIIIGAMKCGTSTLAAQLGGQDGIFMTDPKEPNYFSDDAVFEKGPDWYARLFVSAAPGEIRGEASTHYTKRPDLPHTLRRMTTALPQVRLIYMIRNPMERLVSHYIHAWSEGWVSRPLEAVLDNVPSLVDYGRYGWQVAPFVEAYGADAILLTSLERLKGDPGGELTRIARHIGHDGPVRWIEAQSAQNVSAERARRFPMQEFLIENPVATALRRTLVPKAVRTHIREARQMRERPEIPPSVRPVLEARFAADRVQLADIFPGDPSLDLAYPFLS